MTTKVIVVSGIMAVLGIISMLAGIAGEATRIKASEVRIEHFSCVYPRSPSLGFGILAIVCTAIIRIILLVVVERSSSTLTPTYTVVNISSWIASVAAVILYLAAVVLSNREGGQQEGDGVLTCYVVKPGVFAAGATFSIFSTFLGIVAYKTVSSATPSTSRLELEPPNALMLM